MCLAPFLIWHFVDHKTPNKPVHSSSAASLLQAWAQTEGGLLRGAAAYCMDRFQRYTCSRPGYTVLNWGYEFGGLFSIGTWK